MAKPTFYIDLDETLGRAQLAPDGQDIIGFRMRHGVYDFIKVLHPIGKLILFTFGVRPYAEVALTSMGIRGAFKKIVSREDFQKNQTRSGMRQFMPPGYLFDNNPTDNPDARTKMAALGIGPSLYFHVRDGKHGLMNALKELERRIAA